MWSLAAWGFLVEAQRRQVGKPVPRRDRRSAMLRVLGFLAASLRPACVWLASGGTPLDLDGYSEIARANWGKLGNHRSVARCGLVPPPWKDYFNTWRPSAGIFARGRPFGLLV